jgi:hypothetical protein
MGIEVFISVGVFTALAIGIVQLIGPLIVRYDIDEECLTMSFALIPVRTIALADITGVMVIPWWRAFTFLLVWRFRNRPFAESIVLRLRGDRAPVINRRKPLPSSQNVWRLRHTLEENLFDDRFTLLAPHSPAGAGAFCPCPSPAVTPGFARSHAAISAAIAPGERVKRARRS